MKSDKESISRLKRIELIGQDYKNFIQPLFAMENVDNRIDYIKWLLEKNPALHTTEDLPIYIYREESEPIGQLAIIPVEIVFSGNPIRGGWCIDFHISRKAQGRGVGNKLLQTAHEDFPLLLTLGQTDMAFNLFRKRGWHFCGSLTHYKKLLNYTYTLPKLFLKKAGFSFNKKRSKLIPNQHFFNDYKNIKIEEITSFSNYEISKINDPKSEYYIKRSKKFLNWRYIDFPFASYKILKICLLGCSNIFAILRMSYVHPWYQAKLVDLLYPINISRKELRIILKLIISYASSYGAEQFECKTSDLSLISALPNAIFTTKVISSRLLYGTISMDSCPFISADKWKLFAGDCDVDTLNVFSERNYA